MTHFITLPPWYSLHSVKSGKSVCYPPFPVPRLVLALREETTDIPCSWPWHSLPAYCFIVPELPAGRLLLLNHRSASSAQILLASLSHRYYSRGNREYVASSKVLPLSLFLMKVNLDLHMLDTEFEPSLPFFKSTFMACEFTTYLVPCLTFIAVRAALPLLLCMLMRFCYLNCLLWGDHSCMLAVRVLAKPETAIPTAAPNSC